MAPRNVVLAGIFGACSFAQSANVDLAAVLGGSGVDGGYTTENPDPNVLVWDKNTSEKQPGFRAGWLNVPVLHDPYITNFEKSPTACLRVLMKPARVQPARLGSIFLHCGGPGSDASCAPLWGKWFELNSTYLVGEPLSDEYDYWSISQRGMDQHVLEHDGFKSECPFKDANGEPVLKWPKTECHGIDKLIKEKGESEALRRLPGNPGQEILPLLQEIRDGPQADTFGNPFFNETYARWAYRLIALEHNLCFHDDMYKIRSTTTNRTYNALEHIGTINLAKDIEIYREAVGAKKMSVYGVSYGTKVGSVYATMFPDKVHRLILDGDMGSDPDIRVFADWVGQSTEAVWTGLAESCDNSVMSGLAPENRCRAGSGVTTKMMKLFKGAKGLEELQNAAYLFNALQRTLYSPSVPCAGALMNCIADMSENGSNKSCFFMPPFGKGACKTLPLPDQAAALVMKWPPTGVGAGLEVIGSVLGMDLAGRLTEESWIQVWRTMAEQQPLGITRSFSTTLAVATWPAVPTPQPPAGSAVVAPLVIGNLHDGQTPYKMAQRMLTAFPSGRLLTSQFYGHGLQGPENVTQVVDQYEEEMKRGVLPEYTDDVGKLLCVKVALQYLKDGTLPRDYICKAAAPKQTGPGPSLTDDAAVTEIIV